MGTGWGTGVWSMVLEPSVGDGGMVLGDGGMVLEPSVGDGTGWGHGSGARFGARVWGTVLEHGLGDGLGDRGLEHGFWSPVWGTGAWFWGTGA